MLIYPLRTLTHLLPDAPDRKLIEDRICAEQGHGFNVGLGGEDAIEGIVVNLRGKEPAS